MNRIRIVPLAFTFVFLASCAGVSRAIPSDEVGQPNDSTAAPQQEETRPALRTGIPLNEIRAVYLRPMPGDLDEFLAASLQKWGVYTVTIDSASAEAYFTGTLEKGDDKWFHVAFGSGKDKNNGSVMLIDPRAKVLIWSGSAGDKSFLFNSLKKGGSRKIADRLVDQLKKSFEAAVPSKDSTNG